MSIRTETETVVKRILPYLERRGYSIIDDLNFETAVKTTERYTMGYIDILVKSSNTNVGFLIEAKRISKKLTTKDRDQAVSYANSKEINAPFVVVTNGVDIHCYNTKNKDLILWDGKNTDKIPSKEQLKLVMRKLRTNPYETVVNLSNDESLPFRPGLPLRQLNTLFTKAHNTIRKIEKNEEYAFSDFSKLLFLKLLEEKNDIEESFSLPYSYRFYELAEYHLRNADQVRDAIRKMINTIKEDTKYGEVLKDNIKLNNPITVYKLVKELSAVSFYDCSVDSKGAAFEYFVRATLKGKKLGQYFTPRELVKVMSALVGQEKIVNSVLLNTRMKVLDPACGTGGFLVYLMQDTIQKVIDKYNNRLINKQTCDSLIDCLQRNVFFGSDANEGVAASAKMNMIIAGDGHTNIQNEDSLSRTASNWSIDNPDCTLILTNPPFGTSETDSLSDIDKKQFDVTSAKGQYLFLQKMIDCTVSGGEICTVIDEGVMNTESGKNLREYILKTCKIKAIVNLPPETFRPNKINVKASLLYLEKREHSDDFEDQYKITVATILSLGYHGSGEKIRGFNFDKFIHEIGTMVLERSTDESREGYYWKAFDIESQYFYDDATHRFDSKYWSTVTRGGIDALLADGHLTIKELNQIKTIRGKSPSADSYVDEPDGFAVVIKAGNIGKLGQLLCENADWIEKSVYDEYVQLSAIEGKEAYIIKRNDVLLASTGEGTLGKCGVYNLEVPAIPDGHVTIIRVDEKIIDPYYLADYLRVGFGAEQIERLFTGSTGLIELTPDQVNSIVIDMRMDIMKQKQLSKQVRKKEAQYSKKLKEAEILLAEAKKLL